MHGGDEGIARDEVHLQGQDAKEQIAVGVGRRRWHGGTLNEHSARHRLSTQRSGIGQSPDCTGHRGASPGKTVAGRVGQTVGAPGTLDPDQQDDLPERIRREPTMCFPLDSQQRKVIARCRPKTRDYRLGMRLSAILWRDDGKAESEIAHLLGVCERTVRNWLRHYRKKGLEVLCLLHYKGDPGELISSQAGRFRCARQVREWLQATFGIAYSLSGTKRLPQRLGCSFHKTTGFLFKAKRDKQEEFVQVVRGRPRWIGKCAHVLPPGFERPARGLSVFGRKDWNHLRIVGNWLYGVADRTALKAKTPPRAAAPGNSR
jgi:transposase